MMYVIAGTETQAYNWINSKLEERIRNGEFPNQIDEYKYVHSANVLRGIKNPHGIFVGTWRERKDIKEIVEALLYSTMGVNETISKLYQQLTRQSPAVAVASKALSDEIDNEVLRNALNGKRINSSWRKPDV